MMGMGKADGGKGKAEIEMRKAETSQPPKHAKIATKPWPSST